MWPWWLRVRIPSPTPISFIFGLGIINKKWKKRVLEIAREEAEKITNDPFEPEEIRERAREFLEKGSQKEENEKEEK